MGDFSRVTMSIKFSSGMIILLFATLLSFLYSVNVNALTLDPVLNVVAPVTKIVHRDEETTNNGPQDTGSSRSTQASAKAKKAPQQSLVQPSPTSGDNTPPASEESFVAAPLSELPTIDISDVPQANVVRAITPVATTSTESAVLGAQTNNAAAPLRATEQGWAFFGVAWYWWLFGGVVVYGVVRQITLMRQRPSVSESPIVS